MGADRDRNASASGGHRAHRSKVDRLLEAYDLPDFGEKLEQRWLGEVGERQSLRDLADRFNQQLLDATLDRAGERLIEGEVENLYRLLTDPDVSTAARVEAETKLDRLGIDIDSLRRDFVSHQAVHTYLTKYRGVEPPGTTASAETALENRIETIQRLQHRLDVVTERSLESLRDAGHLSLESFDVLVRVTVYCDACDSSIDAIDLLGQGGCDCQLQDR